MKIYFERMARVRIKDEDSNFTWWATYKWNENECHWYCTDSNSGFHAKHKLPWNISEHEMTVLVLQSS